jgi:hypothetical protein
MAEPRQPPNMKAAYELAYRKAAARLLAGELEELCRRRGAARSGRLLSLSYFGSRVELHLPEQAGASQRGAPQPSPEALRMVPEDLPLTEKILILHYLVGEGEDAARDSSRRHGGQGPAHRGEMVSFKSLPGAAFYDAAYQKRGPRRIAARFGRDLAAFRRAGASLGWRAAELGDASFRFDIFPGIEGLVVLHGADEEFPAEASILFSENVRSFLPLEDVAVLAGVIATRLARAA